MKRGEVATIIKKIMFVDERKVVNYSGGAEKVICEFANEFTRRGFNISIVCMDEKLGLPFHPLNENVHFVNLCYDYGKPFGGIKWLAKKFQREVMRGLGGKNFVIAGKHYQDPKKQYFFSEFVQRLTKCVDDLTPDLIISVSEDSAYIAQVAAPRIPIIAMCHSDPIDFADQFTDVHRRAWQNAKYVQVLQPRFVQSLSDLGISGNVVVIPNAVEQVPDADIVNLSVCRKRIITAGRLEGATKRQHILLEAFAQIAKRFPDWQLDIYGAADNLRYQKRLLSMVKKLNLENKVRFFDVTENFLGVLKDYDIFAFPSRREGFGLALAEAMSAGLPVVACRECYPEGNNEFIRNGETGLLSTDSPYDFAEKIMLLISDAPLRQKIGSAAHEAMKVYDGVTVWDKWENLIDSI